MLTRFDMPILGDHDGIVSILLRMSSNAGGDLSAALRGKRTTRAEIILNINNDKSV